MEPLYTTTIQCVCCDTSYVTSKVRPSFKKAVSIDADFCGNYNNGINPDYYVVRVCPHCGFAATENGFKHLNEHQKKNYLKKVGNNWKYKDYSGERNREQAMNTYKLALITAQVTGAKIRIIAGILHHIAWLFRYNKNEKEEQRFLGYALEAYIRVYEEEDAALNNARLMYLIGELYRRLGIFNEAVKWFSKVVNDKRIMDAAMIRASREQWQLIRESMDMQSAEKMDAVTGR